MRKILSFLVLLLATPALAQQPGQIAGGTYSYGYYSTYSSTALDVVLAASATDVACISGSASRTIIVKHISMSGFATATAVGHGHIQKRSTANTGGTSTTPAVVPHDSQGAPGTAVIRAYTANPTTGTLVGTVAAGFITYAAESATWPELLEFHFGSDGMQGIVLRGTTESLCMNSGGNAVAAGAALSVVFNWIEQ